MRTFTYIIVPTLSIINMGVDAATIGKTLSSSKHHGLRSGAHARRQFHNADFDKSGGLYPSSSEDHHEYTDKESSDFFKMKREAVDWSKFTSLFSTGDNKSVDLGSTSHTSRQLGVEGTLHDNSSPSEGLSSRSSTAYRRDVTPVNGIFKPLVSQLADYFGIDTSENLGTIPQDTSNKLSDTEVDVDSSHVDMLDSDGIVKDAKDVIATILKGISGSTESTFPDKITSISAPVIEDMKTGTKNILSSINGRQALDIGTTHLKRGFMDFLGRKIKRQGDVDEDEVEEGAEGTSDLSNADNSVTNRQVDDDTLREAVSGAQGVIDVNVPTPDSLDFLSSLSSGPRILKVAS